MRVFVNAAPVDVDAGATAFDCIQRWRDDEANEILSGRRVITDSRGLPIPADTRAQAGSIYRTIPNRAVSG